MSMIWFSFAFCISVTVLQSFDSIVIAKLNVDENPQTAADYGITSIPTVNVYSGGQVVKTIIGAKPKAALLADLAEYL